MTRLCAVILPDRVESARSELDKEGMLEKGFTENDGALDGPPLT